MLCGSTAHGILPNKRNDSWISFRLWLAESRETPLLHICIPQELGPPFFILLACDLPGGISSLQELQRRLHSPVSSSPHGHHKGKEQNPEKNPEKPPEPMHSPEIVVHRSTFMLCG